MEPLDFLNFIWVSVFKASLSVMLFCMLRLFFFKLR